MKKESLSTAMAKLIMVVSLIVGIGAVMGLLGYLSSAPRSNNFIKPPSIPSKTCEANSDCYEYSPCGMGSTCLSKLEYDRAIKNFANIVCPAVEVYPWRRYRYNKEECSCLESSCAKVYSEEKYCKSLEESLKWCGDDKPFDYEYSLDKNECLEMKNLFDDSCVAENDIKDETSSWKTYRNDENNYEFKYPDNLLIDEEVSKNHVYLWTKEQFAIFKNGEITDSILWVTSDSLNNLSLENYIKAKKTDISEKEYLNFNNLEILRIYEQGYGKGTNIYYIASEEEVVIIGTVLDKKNAVISQIIATFEFIEKEESTGWKTYRNEEYGFEFKYPDDNLYVLDKKRKFSSVILESYESSNIEDSISYSLGISLEEVENNAKEDAIRMVESTPVGATSTGPFKKQVNENEVYFITYKLYDGGEGFSKSYYFSDFVLIFAYANNMAEDKLNYLEKNIFTTLKFIRKEDFIEWNIYTNPEVDFTFKYPKNWEIKDDYFHKGLSGEISKKRTVVLKAVSQEDSNEWININMRQFQCHLGKCLEVSGNTIGTYSDNLETLNIINKISTTFKFID